MKVIADPWYRGSGNPWSPYHLGKREGGFEPTKADGP